MLVAVNPLDWSVCFLPFKYRSLFTSLSFDSEKQWTLNKSGER